MKYAAAVLFSFFACAAVAQEIPYRAARFPQELAVRHGAESGMTLKDPQKVFIDADGNILVHGSDGKAVYANGKWTVTPFDAAARKQHEAMRTLMTGKGLVHTHDTNLKGTPVLSYSAITATTAMGTAEGLFESTGGKTKRVIVEDGLGRTWATSDVRAVTYDSQGRLWVGVKAGVACRDGEKWTFYTGAEGLPYSDFTCAAAGPNGEVWFGTHMGAVRFDGREWAYRQGKCWLPNDDIRSVAVDAKGNAWFATAGGVGCIERRMMTLAEKAAFYEDEIDRYIKRTEYGYTSEVGLKKPGDKSEIIYSDSDNDGLWTSMYGASQCYAYAVTKSAKSKERAKQAFEALRFLQKVTQGCEHAPPKGYVARTILPTSGPDPNIGRLEQDRHEQATEDHGWKVYEPRWPKSADGKWYWKSDTSSDELDGHYFFYPLYYDLVADTEDERARVREVVRDLTDQMLEHDFALIDHDGKPTRWAVFGPKEVNRNSDWWSERGINSLSMLSYLAVAQHVCGDTKYGKAIKRLCEEHNYDSNLTFPKVQYGVGSGNQSDDEMMCMSFYNLLKYAKDEKLRARAVLGFYNFWVVESPEMNPLFNFAFAAFGRGAKSVDPWGEHPLDPWGSWLEDSMATLHGFPLDRVTWGHKNSQRLDIVKLSLIQRGDPLAPAPPNRGHRVNGKVLPVENRHFGHWNTDPWHLNYGGDGHGLDSGAVFLLPYYMGIYHGFIQETEASK